MILVVLIVVVLPRTVKLPVIVVSRVTNKSLPTVKSLVIVPPAAGKARFATAKAPLA